MSVVSIISDWGVKDHYAAIMKANLYAAFPKQKIVELTHDIEPFDKAAAAFVLKAVWNNFGEGSLHLLSVSTANSQKDMLLASYQGRYILCSDNDILNFLGFELDELVSLGFSDSTFPELDLLVPIIKALKKGKALSDLGEAFSLKKMKIANRTYDGERIVADILHIDRYGNVFLNIDEAYFEAKRKDRRFVLAVKRSRYKVEKIVKSFDSVSHHEIFALFNTLGLLEIGMRGCNMGELIGLDKEDKVLILFKED